MLNQIRLPPEQMTERLCSCNQQQPLQALIALRNLTVEAISTLASNEQKRRIFTILLHKCEFTDELREAEESATTPSSTSSSICARTCCATPQPACAPASRRDSPRCPCMPRLVGLFTDWTRDTELFAPRSIRGTDRPAVPRSGRDWPDDRPAHRLNDQLT